MMIRNCLFDSFNDQSAEEIEQNMKCLQSTEGEPDLALRWAL